MRLLLINLLETENNTVSYSGQSQRIAMAEELISALKDQNRDEASLRCNVCSRSKAIKILAIQIC